MANPVFVDCTADTWQLVAENVTAGVIHKVSGAPDRYLQTYKLTGEDAPEGIALGVGLFDDSDHEIIDSSVAIDVYVYAISDAGRVRVDL